MPGGGAAPPGRRRVRREVEDQGRRCRLRPGDLTDPEFCREAAERTAEELGGLNILVSNAAYLNSELEVGTGPLIRRRSRKSSSCI